MKRLKKFFLLLFVAFVILLSSEPSTVSAAAPKYGILISDNEITLYDDLSVVSPEKNVMIKAEAICKHLGLTYSYNSKTKKITIKNNANGKSLVFTADKKEYTYFSSKNAKGLVKKATYQCYYDNKSKSYVIHYSPLSNIIKCKYFKIKGDPYYDTKGYDGVVFCSTTKSASILPLPTEVPLPKLRIITESNDSVQVINNDIIEWDSQQGNYIACSGDNLYYSVEDDQLRYVKIGHYDPKIILKEWGIGPDHSYMIPGTDYFVVNTQFSSYIMNAASGGSNPDKIVLDDRFNGFVYHNGYIYDINYRINIDSYNLGNAGKEYELSVSNDVEDIFLGREKHVFIGDYNYYYDDNNCIRINLETKTKETFYSIADEIGVAGFDRITNVCQIGEYVVYSFQYKDGKFITYHLLLYNTVTGTCVEINDMDSDIFFSLRFNYPYKDVTFVDYWYQNGFGAYYINQESLYKVGFRINATETKIYNIDEELIFVIDNKIYYFIITENTVDYKVTHYQYNESYNDICHVDILE